MGLYHDVRRSHQRGGAPEFEPFLNSYSGAMQKKMLYAGVDVSADRIDVACQPEKGHPEAAQVQHRQFANEPSGHEKLIGWLRGNNRSVRIAVEASGAYSTDLCLALHNASDIAVMVLNPRAVKDYRRSQMQRTKTDRIDAAVLCDYTRRMPFTPWEPPEGDLRELRQVTRRIQALTTDCTRERERLHAAKVTQTTSSVVVNDLEVNIRHLKRRIDEMTRQAMKIVRRSSLLNRAYEHVTSVGGTPRRVPSNFSAS